MCIGEDGADFAAQPAYKRRKKHGPNVNLPITDEASKSLGPINKKE